MVSHNAPMSKPTLGRRLNDALAALLMSAQGPAVDFTRGGLGTTINGGKADSSPPPRYGEEVRMWVDRAERLVLALEREAGLATPTKPRRTAKELREVIRQHDGRDAVYVAFVEGCSTQLVYKVRASVGLDPEGERRPRALTTRVLPTAEDIEAWQTTEVGQNVSSTYGSLTLLGEIAPSDGVGSDG